MGREWKQERLFFAEQSRLRVYDGVIQGVASSAYFIFHTGTIEPVLNDLLSHCVVQCETMAARGRFPPKRDIETGRLFDAYLPNV
jgi:hypothetical protein